MKQATRLIGGLVVGALVVAGATAAAERRQFRESIVVQGSVSGALGEHHLTFSGPVALPGVSLAPGTYIFERPASNVLRVSNARRQPYAMLMTVPVSRIGPTDRYEIVVGPGLAEGAPRRLEAWFAPGDSTGQQLIYRGSNR